MLFSTPFTEQLQQRGTAPAIVHPDGRVTTCADLYRNSTSLAHGLLRLGARPGQRAVIAAEPDGDFVCIVYAAMMLGWELAIIDPEMGREHYQAKLAQFAPEWAFTDSRLLLLQEHPLIRFAYLRMNPGGVYLPYVKGVQVVAMGRRMPLLRRHARFQALVRTPVPAGEAPVRAPEDVPFLITYTSGTLAAPKGVVHTLRSLGESIRVIADLMRSDLPQRLATHLPHFVLIGIAAEIPVYLWEYRRSAEEKLGFIARHRITTLFNPPADYLPLMEAARVAGNPLPESLAHVLFGSAPVHAIFLEKIAALLPVSCRMTALYGMTENLVVCVADGREKIARTAVAGDWLGFPVAGVELRCAGDDEILVQSPQLFAGYFRQPPRDAWHATGDTGHLLPDGSLALTGRKKDMIIRRNLNLYPALYEPTICRIPGVRDCALIGLYDHARHDERVVLCVEGEASLSVAGIRAQLVSGKYALDREALPDHILLLPLPRKGRQQKTDRQALRLLAAEKFPDSSNVSHPDNR